MDQKNPNPTPASAKEANENREKPEDPKKRRADQATGKPELDGKNDSGVEPEIHGHELPGE